MTLKRASYRHAVQWIALNDESGNHDDEDTIALYVSTSLIADLFGTTVEKVAHDIFQLRIT